VEKYHLPAGGEKIYSLWTEIQIPAKSLPFLHLATTLYSNDWGLNTGRQHSRQDSWKPMWIVGRGLYLERKPNTPTHPPPCSYDIDFCPGVSYANTSTNSTQTYYVRLYLHYRVLPLKNMGFYSFFPFSFQTKFFLHLPSQYSPLHQ
jgi:hypothetical protein